MANVGAVSAVTNLETMTTHFANPVEGGAAARSGEMSEVAKNMLSSVETLHADFQEHAASFKMGPGSGNPMSEVQVSDPLKSLDPTGAEIKEFDLAKALVDFRESMSDVLGVQKSLVKFTMASKVTSNTGNNLKMFLRGQ